MANDWQTKTAEKQYHLMLRSSSISLETSEGGSSNGHFAGKVLEQDKHLCSRNECIIVNIKIELSGQTITMVKKVVFASNSGLENSKIGTVVGNRHDPNTFPKLPAPICTK